MYSTNNRYSNECLIWLEIIKWVCCETAASVILINAHHFISGMFWNENILSNNQTRHNKSERENAMEGANQGDKDRKLFIWLLQ